jgi:murein peptide amidase A
MVQHPEKSFSGLRRLGKNISGYLGVTIDIDAVLSSLVSAGRAHSWNIEEMAAEGLDCLAFTRNAGAHKPGPKASAPPARGSDRPPLRVYISTGIHGDEPAGPLAIQELLTTNPWPCGVDLYLCPCLNPAGFRLNRRENSQGLDLNRQYQNPIAQETLAHIAWLKRQPRFDLSLCLHEDWESHGFYVYELNPDHQPSLAEAIVQDVAEVCPIDCSELIEGRPAQKGIIRPSVDPRSRPDWPEAFFLITWKTRLSYTLEAPSDFPLSARVAALVRGVKAALQAIAAPA